MRSYRLLSFVVAVLLLAALSVTTLPVLAHEDVDVGPYALEVGWVDEPPLAGVKNAVFLSVVEKESGQPVEDISNLQVAISAGGLERELTMRPLRAEMSAAVTACSTDVMSISSPSETVGRCGYRPIFTTSSTVKSNPK